jgi:hypothetical protein
MFSSFGTVRTDDIGTRFGALDTQVSRVTELPEVTCPESRYPEGPQEPFDLGLIELPLPSSAHYPLPSSGIPTRRNSSVSDVSAVGKIQEKEKAVEVDITDPNFVLDISPANSTQHQNQDQARDFDLHRDLEAGNSSFDTYTDADTPAAIEEAQAQFQRDHPDLTEHVTF